MKKTFVLRPEDSAFFVLKSMVALCKQMLVNGIRVSVVISKYVQSKTPPQHRTVFMWNGEVATQLNIMGALSGSNVKWTTEDVHEMVFKRQMMPQVNRTLPDGQDVSRPIGLSDKEATIDVVAEAMCRYQVWAIERGIELTQPEDREYR